MKLPALVLTGAGLWLALSGLVSEPRDRLIWNRTGSAPKGLYWLSDEPFTHGRWVVVSSQSAGAKWAGEHGLIGRDWPLLKQVAGISGDEICREGTRILINSERRAEARLHDSRGRALPVWEGCLVLGQGEFFLLSPHPASLDGRYFGLTEAHELTAAAYLLLTFGD